MKSDVVSFVNFASWHSHKERESTKSTGFISVCGTVLFSTFPVGHDIYHQLRCQSFELLINDSLATVVRSLFISSILKLMLLEKKTCVPSRVLIDKQEHNYIPSKCNGQVAFFRCLCCYKIFSEIGMWEGKQKRQVDMPIKF